MNVEPATAGFSPKRLERITDHLLRHYIDPGKISGCQLLVARHGQPAYYGTFGAMDIERNKPMADDTIFRIYSMTKPITSIALMQLYEQGLFQLNDPVHRVIPAWRDLQVYVSGDGDRMETRAPDTTMTFRHLLTHTSGLCYGVGQHPIERRYEAEGLRARRQDLQTFIDKLAGIPLRFDPGTRWMYSYATDVCGYLVQRLSGQSFDQYLNDHVFGPLGMTDTAFSVGADKVERFAANYGRRRDKTLELIDDPERSVYLEHPAFLSGGGGLTGTLADYWRFCEMLRRGGELDGERIIGSRTLELMTRNHLPNGGDLSATAIGAFSETAYEGVGFGLGFAMTLDEVDSGSLGPGDYYWGGAASTIFWVDPHEDLVVIFMTQLMPSATFNFRGQLKSIIYSAFDD
jgi:CubicO group peptidase (beta-lactamase class C family)